MSKEKCILLVDDEKIMRDEFKQIFEDTRYKLDVAIDSLGGLEKIRSGSYDLIFLDIKMPDLEGRQSDRAGLDLLLRVRELKPNLPVIMVTALNDANSAMEAVKSGARDYLVKGDSSEKKIVEKCDEIIFLEPLEKEIKKILISKKKINMYDLYKELNDIQGLDRSNFKIILDKLEENKLIEMDSQFNITLIE